MRCNLKDVVPKNEMGTQTPQLPAPAPVFLSVPLGAVVAGPDGAYRSSRDRWALLAWRRFWGVAPRRRTWS